jgi:hypothetical protein
MLPRKLALAILLGLLVSLGVGRATPFFAMDTGITGDPVTVAETLDALGYD